MYQMAKSLIQYDNKVIIVTGRVSGLTSEEEADGIKIYLCYDSKEIRSKTVAERTLSIANDHHVDVIEGADHIGECARLISMARRPPILIKYHSCQVLNSLTSAEIVYGWQRITVMVALMRIWRQRRAERVCIECPDFAIAPSLAILHAYKKQGTKIPWNCSVIPNTFSPYELPSGARESEHPVLLYAGRVQLQKGIHYLPSILKSILVRHPDTILEIAGSDCYARGLGSLTQWLKGQFGSLLPHVRFLGPLSAQELDKAYTRAWVFIFPTRWDNFPMVILEAMARGKAIVTTPHGGMPEMLAGTGSPIEEPSALAFAEAVCRLLGDCRERERIGHANWQKVQNYSPEKIIPQYINFLKANL
jgi:glycosyltransferase involved in cell wall biosynthesis